MVLVAGAAWLMHLPVYFDAKRRGFDQEFVSQYSAWVYSIGKALHFRVGAGKPARTEALPAQPAPAKREARVKTGNAPTHSWNREILRRSAWRDFIDAPTPEKRALTVLTYAPLLSLIPLIFWAVVRLARGALSDEPGAIRRPLAALVLLGGALTTFPQFFFFRPDSPHLSEFSPGFWIAVAGSALLLGAHTGSWRNPRRLAARLLVVFLCAHAGTLPLAHAARSLDRHHRCS
jgi:hypothetical protein